MLSPESNVVILDWGENTQCSVNLHGCTITSWRLKNWEQLFVSRHSKFNQRKEIMGGISINFPRYGGWKFGPPNGFACISKWKLIKGPYRTKDTDDVVAVFQLVDNPHTRSFWNFQFEITTTITLSETFLDIKTKLKNTSTSLPMQFQLMFPVFIKVPKIELVKITGMTNVQYHDETVSDNVIRTDRRKAIEITDWIYRIYKEAPHMVEVLHITSDYKLTIENSGLNDFMVWNPWDNHGENVDDFRAEQYADMICIGMGNINNEMRLEPKKEITCSIKFVIDTGEGICTGFF